MSKLFIPALDAFGPSPKQPMDLLRLGEPVPTTVARSFGILLKLPERRWMRTCLSLNGKPLTARAFDESYDHICQSIVGGWHTQTQLGCWDWPYDLVANDEGRTLCLPDSLRLLPNLRSNDEPLRLCGAVFLLQWRVTARHRHTWMPKSIDLLDFHDADDAVGRAARLCIMDFAARDFEPGLFRVDLTTVVES